MLDREYSLQESFKLVIKVAICLIADIVFCQGDDRLGPETRKQLIGQHRARQKMAKMIWRNKLWELCSSRGGKIKEEMEKPSFRLEVKYLKKLLHWKTIMSRVYRANFSIYSVYLWVHPQATLPVWICFFLVMQYIAYQFRWRQSRATFFEWIDRNPFAGHHVATLCDYTWKS